VLLGVAFVLLISVRGIAAFYTDYLWFDSLALTDVWFQVLGTKLALALAGGVAFFLLCWGNLLIADRLAPAFRPSNGDDDLIERYHELVGRRAWAVRFGVALFLALLVGVSLGAAWNEWVLFANRVDFGEKDATFGTDIGFYVFQLPFLQSVSSWLFSSLVVIFLVTVFAHVVNGGIRFHTQLDRVTPQVKAHLSVLLGLLALVQVGRYWLGRYELVFSTRGFVDGATYTDANVTLRATYLLMMIALFAFGLFIANIWRRGWVLPVMAVGLWALVGVVAGVMVPAFVQRVRVEPTESTREREYIENNIAATRQAYNLGAVKELPLEWTGEVTSEDLQANQGTLENVRLWDPESMRTSMRTRQEFKSFFDVGDVDVDRYEIDGQQAPVMIAARDLNPAGVPGNSWESTHLIYTNGYAVVAAPANDASTGGAPRLVAKDIPATTSAGFPEIDEPRIFFGENWSSYVIVNTDVRVPESDEGAAAPDYDGADGVVLGSGVNGFLRKAAFSLRFGDINPLLSGSLRPDSRVIMQRDLTARLDAIAPFLAYDHDPYMAVVDGRLQYVIDAYTTTRNYPNAQRADTGGLDPSSGLYGRSFNYARNSVKAVVDAYDGTVTLYVVDDQDPMVRAYQKAFPDLFTDGDEAPAALREHFRYPEDLFTVQTQMWAKYHVEDPQDFYDGRDIWAVPQADGGTQQVGSRTVVLGPDGQELTPDDRYPSQYVLMQLPGEEEESFVIMRPYVNAPAGDEDGGQNQLRSFITASSDPDNFGELRTYVVDSTELPEGPKIAADEMKASDDVAAQIRSQCTEKTVCTFTSPSIVPVGDSLLYVQSFLVAGSREGAPQVEHVIVNYRRPGESEVVIDDTLYGALEQLFPGEVPASIHGGGSGSESEEPTEPTEPSDPAEPSEPDPDQPEPSAGEQERQLIADLVAAFDAADAAGREGDLVGQAEALEQARDLAEQLQALQGESGGIVGDAPSGTTPTTTPQTTTTTTAGA
jgi:uncharacterized membrane protein (UPF0182 family)